MAKIQAPKRIDGTDYASDEQELVGKLAFSLNVFMDDVYNALTQKLSIGDNFNQEIKTFAVKVDVDGKPSTTTAFKSSLSGRAQGLQIIRTFGSSLVDSTPFIDFTEEGNVITINNIKGLVADTEYNIVILILGS